MISNAAQGQATTKAIAPKRARILLVDDEEFLRHVLHKVLVREGYDVILAANGLEGLGHALWPGQQVDLVVTDLSMPVLNGPEFVAQIRETRPDIPVLYLSGYPVSELAAAPATRFLQKPFGLPDFKTAVRGLLESAPVMARKAS